jgi:hypothetical protein
VKFHCPPPDGESSNTVPPCPAPLCTVVPYKFPLASRRSGATGTPHWFHNQRRREYFSTRHRSWIAIRTPCRNPRCRLRQRHTSCPQHRVPLRPAGNNLCHCQTGRATSLPIPPETVTARRPCRSHIQNRHPGPRTAWFRKCFRPDRIPSRQSGAKSRPPD